jgi:hypothetical protein
LQRSINEWFKRRTRAAKAIQIAQRSCEAVSRLAAIAQAGPRSRTICNEGWPATRAPRSKREPASKMTVQNHVDPGTSRSRPRWAYIWHAWKVIVPRRSITGRLVYGRVWRRHNGRRWIYKNFVKYDPRKDESKPDLDRPRDEVLAQSQSSSNGFNNRETAFGRYFCCALEDGGVIWRWDLRSPCHTPGLPLFQWLRNLIWAHRGDSPMKNYFDRTSHRVLAIIGFWLLIGLVLWLGGWWR